MNNSKPTFRQLSFHTNSTLNIKVDSGENLRNTWHYHPEIELILLKGSKGTRIIGNSVEAFNDNDVLLIGKNTPHSFLHEEKYLQNRCDPPKAVVVQFYETFMGKEFLELPEFKQVQNLLTLSQQGLCLTERGKKKIIPLMEKMLRATSLDRILLLLQILSVMATKGCYEPIITKGFIYQTKSSDDSRIKKILDFTSENFDKNIKIEQVAEIINLTKESFCRYFKSQTGKSYLEFLIEYRINKACAMMLKNQTPVKEIAYSCGFESLSNFHYQFKKIIQKSPVEYRQSCP